ADRARSVDGGRDAFHHLDTLDTKCRRLEELEAFGGRAVQWQAVGENLRVMSGHTADPNSGAGRAGGKRLHAYAVDMIEQLGHRAGRSLDRLVHRKPVGGFDIRRLIRAASHVAHANGALTGVTRGWRGGLVPKRDVHRRYAGGDVHRQAVGEEAAGRDAERASTGGPRERRETQSVGRAVRGAAGDGGSGDGKAVGSDAHDDASGRSLADGSAARRSEKGERADSGP